MIILITFAFLAGIVTVLSPCILPILPIVLSSSVGGKGKPYGVVTGFVVSFTFFTLFLTTIVKSVGFSADSLRNVSVIVLLGFGISLLLPKFQEYVEILFARISKFVPNSSNKSGFIGGFIIGLSVGLLWTPCVGPILASVISLALTGEVTFQAVTITLAYSLGTAIPMLFIIKSGRKIVEKIPNPALIQKVFGGIMILTALAIFLGWDRNFQTWVLTTFPKYGANLTNFEEKVFEDKNKIQNSAPELILGGRWIGSEPLKLEDLRGKVVLIDFWTYTCINCQRTIPYLRGWWEKYKDRGLVIIGVHSPEFEFEKDPANVQKAVRDFGITYPVMQDNNFATWRAYNNRYWPAKYLIDKDGIIRYTHFGEGKYDETEKKIQELLDIEMTLNNPVYRVDARTPETYLGLLRRGSNVNFEGEWNDSAEYANPEKGSALEITFEAKQVFLVMDKIKTDAKVAVILDGQKQKEVTVTEAKLYELINLQTPGRHLLRLEFNDNQAKLFAFTFG